ncbi:MAG: hypothetical protein Q9165_006430 [Trypethelium subeluteriae]
MDTSDKYKLPDGAWDSHVHVVDEENFPFDPNYPYRPKKADLDDLLEFERSLGIDHVCLVAMSVYDTDNSINLDALGKLKGQGRAVACIDPETISNDELLNMHKSGVRGVRMNLRTRSQALSKEAFANRLHLYADRIRHLNWVLQIFISLPQLALFAEEIPKLGVPVVLDHLAQPEHSIAPSKQAGYSEFMNLLKERKVWTKFSGTYRFSDMPELEQYAKDIISLAPTQIVWASDWPHSGGVERLPDGDRTKHQDYRQVDDLGFLRQCIDWCNGDETLIRQIWVDNPRRLWQFE